MNPGNHLVKATEEEQPQDQQGYQSLVGSLMYLAERKSTSGYVFCIAGGPVSWKSKIQDTVALSTSEAEYVALSSASQDCIRIRRLNSEFGNTLEDPTIIRVENCNHDSSIVIGYYVMFTHCCVTCFIL